MARTPLLEIVDLYHLFVIALVNTCAAVPSSGLERAAVRGISALAERISRSKRSAIERGVRRAFGDVSPERLRAITNGAFRDTWEEIFSSTRKRDRSAATTAELVGAEHLRAALGRGGVILWDSGALGPRIDARRVLFAHGFAVCQLHGASHVGAFSIGGDGKMTQLRDRVIIPYLDAIMLECVAEIVRLPRSESLAFTRRLRSCLTNKRILCVTGDADEGHRTIRVPFLGSTLRLATGMVSLARHVDAAIVPMFCTRTEHGRLRVTIEAPIEVPAGAVRDDAVAHAAAEFARRLEAYVWRYPDQYRHWDKLE